VANYFTKNLIDHRRIGLAPNVVPELGFDHRERGFDIASLVVMAQELVATELEVMEHLGPQTAASPIVDALECDIGRSAVLCNHIVVVQTAIAFVTRDFPHRKVTASRMDKIRQQLRVAGILITNLNGGNDIRLNPTHQVNLNPFVLLTGHAIFMVIPSDESGRGKARGIYGKIILYCFEWQAGFRNHRSQNGRKTRILQIVEDRIEMRGVADIAFLLGIPQVTHKATAGQGAIDPL